MKYINIQKLIAIISAGFILLSISGCQKKEVSNNNDSSNVENSQHVETPSTNDSNINEDNKLIDTIINQPTTTIPEEKENEIVTYFENLEAEVTSYINQDNFDKVKEKVKNIAITGIDFIFYGTEIKGVTFDGLTIETKEKIMNIVASIDSKIEAKIPGYKETIKDKFGQGYSYVTEKLHEGIDYIDNKLDEKYGQDYQETKDKTSEIVEEVKGTVSDIFDKVSEEASDGWSKIKDWYEDKTGK